MNAARNDNDSTVTEIDITRATARVLSLDGNAAVQLPASAWQLSALLQTSLDVNRVIELFAQELAKRTPHDSFSYRHAERDLSYSRGEPARHALTYRLLLEDRPLGEIAVTRVRRFGGAEIVGVENLISGLVYALRNALLYQEALESALKDPLTGTCNRAALGAALKREIGLAQRHKLPLSVLVLDIDKFKRINDTRGHAVGDAVLCALARGVASCIRSTDVLARYGGEEFVVVLPGTDRAGAALLAARIRRHVEQLRCEAAGPVDREAPCFTVSIGVASLDGNEDSATFLHRADQAMYAAKQLGGNQVGIA